MKFLLKRTKKKLPNRKNMGRNTSHEESTDDNSNGLDDDWTNGGGAESSGT
jgi:hypothetical protein